MTRSDSTPVPDYASLLQLSGKRFVVLGAGQGIGRQASHAFASVGARVLCVDREADLAKEIAEEIDGVAWHGDVTQRDQVERLFQDARQELGGVDGVVDIIGMAKYHDLLETDDELWDWHFDICLRHAMLALQYGGRALHESGARLLLASDAPQIYNVPGFSLVREMRALVEAGLPDYAVLEMGTRNPAVYLDTPNEFGTVQAGARADLLLLSGNPLVDVGQVANLRGVMVRGRWLSREEINRRLAAIAARMRPAALEPKFGPAIQPGAGW